MDAARIEAQRPRMKKPPEASAWYAFSQTGGQPGAHNEARPPETPDPLTSSSALGALGGLAHASVVDKYADIPEYLRLLTSGEDPLYRLPQELQELLIATDLGAKRVNIIYAEHALKVYSQLPWQIKSLKGELRARGYHIVGELMATAAVMQHIARNTGLHAHSSGGGEPRRLFNQWIELAVQAGASDVHIDVHGNTAQVRIRVDGALQVLPDGFGGVYPRLQAVDALAAGYNNTRQGNNVSQYTEDKFVACMIDLNLSGVQGHLRYQNLKGREGPKAVVRILHNNCNAHLSLQSAGYSPSQLRLLAEATRSGKGIVLIAGVTSSGKSTTLKYLIENLPGLQSKAVYTVEDPIEYEIKGAHQIEVLRDLANDELTNQRYADTMRALMRGDPDVVMLGEIRDRLTAHFAMQIAETGHLALGTVHAHLISTIAARLSNEQVGLSRQALSSPGILNLLVYQALVPTVCPHCALTTERMRQEHKSAQVAQLLVQLETQVQVPTQNLRWTRPGGCRHCQGRGTLGRTIVAEMLRPDRTWLKHVKAGDDDAALQHYRSQSDGNLQSPNMTGKTVFEHALYKALQGQIDVRSCEEFESFGRYEHAKGEGQAG
jgi:general secretion pathway protein E